MSDDDDITITNEEYIKLHRKYKFYKNKSQDLDKKVSKLTSDIDILMDKSLKCYNRIDELTCKVNILSKTIPGRDGPQGPPGECKCKCICSK
jgi:uncharacterized coiled-coil DUF342 family protein